MAMDQLGTEDVLRSDYRSLWRNKRMSSRRGIWVWLLFGTLICSQAQPQAQPRDGQHDFDFSFGSWKTQIKRLRHPLTGSKEWTESAGTVVVQKFWDGRANLEELEIDGPDGHIEGLNLRLYNP